MTAKSRIYGLDLARALLLVGGPLVHALTLGHENLPLYTITEGSHLFRMAAFFTIAGFLIALTTKTYKPGWLLGRMRQLGVPLASVGLILWGLRAVLDTVYPGMMFGWEVFPLHLWFLISLIIYSPVTIVMDKVGASEVITKFLDRFNGLLVPFGILTAAAAYFAVALGKQYCRDHGIYNDPIMDRTLFETIKHFPFYMFGFFLARSTKSLALYDKKPVIIMGIVWWMVSMVYFTQLGGIDLVYGPRSDTKNGMIMMTLITEIWLSLSIVLVSLKLKNVSSTVLRFSKSSYTVYLFHFPFIILGAYLLLHYFPKIGNYTLYTTLVVSSLVLSYWTHLFIRKSSFLMFLFNGTKLTKLFSVTTSKGYNKPDRAWNDTFVFIGHIPVMQKWNEEGSQINQWVFCKMMYTRINSTYKRLWLTSKVHATRPRSVDPDAVTA